MKRPTFLEAGRRQLFGRTVRRISGPVEPPPDPQATADFDLGSWRVRPTLARLTRADRLVALDPVALAVLLILAEAPAEGVNRDLLAARVFGSVEAEPKLRRTLSFLRGVLSTDRTVRIENAPGDAYRLVTYSADGGVDGQSAALGPLRETPSGPAPARRRMVHRLRALALAVLVVAAIGVGTVYLLGGPTRPVAGEIGPPTPFAAEPGVAAAPAFAPDGRQVVYSWRAPSDSASHLYLRSTAGGPAHSLTHGEGDDRYPAWSPVGGRIAFVRSTAASCELYLIAPDGSDEKKLTDCSVIGPVAFSRDGGSLLYSQNATPLSPRQLISLALATGTLRGVTNPTIGMPGDTQPALAPNGRRLAFVRTRAPGIADIALIDGAGAVARVTNDELPVAGLSWLPGSRTLLYGSTRGGRASLWRIAADGGTPVLALSGARDLENPVVAPDGRHVLFETWQRHTRLIGVPLGSGLDLPATPLLAAPVADRDPQVSADGLQLCYISHRAGHDELWLATADGAGPHRLGTTGPDYLDSPAWSPDGKHVAVTGGSDGTFDVYVFEVGSGAVRRLTSEGSARSASFSRDGRRLYYASRTSGRYEIWRRLWPEGGAAEPVTTGGGSFGLEARDGDTLFYVRPDRTGLWQRSRDPGGDETLVTAALLPQDAHNWTVTGDAIYFVTRPDGEHAQLVRYSLSNKLVTRLRALPQLYDHSGLAVRMDGRSVIATQFTGAEAQLEVAELR
jgi:Tol biopolymer transport system component/DNA-binding winged helix-turn-helix (wHTH) protein